MRCGRARAVVGAVMASALGSVLLGFAAPAGAQSSSPPSVRFADSAPTVLEGRSHVAVAVERTDLPVSRLLVHYRTEDGPASAGSDYVHTAGTLVFEVGERTAAFTVYLRDDAVAEETEHLQLHLQTSSGSGASTRVTIIDDDLPPSPSTASGGGPGGATTATSVPGRSSVTAAAPPTTTQPVVVAASAGVSRPAPSARVRTRVVPAARPVPRRITLQQTPTTPFELRPSGGTAGVVGAPTAVDPLLALAAGLLLARVGAEVWFRARIAAS